MRKLANIKKIIIVIAVFGLSAVCTAQGAGGKAGSFMRMGIGARAKAMGNAFTALAHGIEASYYNPAGLPHLGNKEVALSYRPLSLDRQYTYVGFGMPIRPKAKGSEKVLNGGFSLSWTRAGTDNIDGRNTDGFHTGQFSNSENAFSFAFALSPATRFSIGLVVKVLWNRFPGVGLSSETVSASGVGFDLGALYRAKDWLSLGLVVKDINSKYRWNTEALYDEDASETIDKFPKALRFGFALHLQNNYGFILVADYEQLYDVSMFKDKIDDRFYAGAEATLSNKFAIRAGIDDGALTAGLGYTFPLFGNMSQINYAYVASNNRPEPENVFTWVLRF